MLSLAEKYEADQIASLDAATEEGISQGRNEAIDAMRTAGLSDEQIELVKSQLPDA